MNTEPTPPPFDPTSSFDPAPFSSESTFDSTQSNDEFSLEQMPVPRQGGQSLPAEAAPSPEPVPSPALSPMEAFAAEQRALSANPIQEIEQPSHECLPLLATDAQPFEPRPFPESRRYHSESRNDPWDAAAVLIAGLIAAAFAGVFASQIAQMGFYFVFIMPVVIGLGIAFVIDRVVYVSKTNNWKVACTAAGIAGLTTVCTMHVCDYFAYNTAAEYKLGFFEYLNVQAAYGVGIGEISLGYITTFFYWGIEAIVIAAIPIAQTFLQAARPFCNHCDEWMIEKEVASFALPASQVVEAIESEKFAILGHRPLNGDESAKLNLYSCDCHHEDQFVVGVDRVTETEEGKQQKGVGCYFVKKAEIQYMIENFGDQLLEHYVLQGLNELAGEVAEFVGEPIVSVLDERQTEIDDYMQRLLANQRDQTTA